MPKTNLRSIPLDVLNQRFQDALDDYAVADEAVRDVRLAANRRRAWQERRYGAGMRVVRLRAEYERRGLSHPDQVPA